MFLTKMMEELFYEIDKLLFKYNINVDGKSWDGEIQAGELKLIPAKLGKHQCQIKVNGNIDIGNGLGNDFEGKINGGEVGIILDGRGREINFLDRDINTKYTTEYIIEFQ